MNYDRARELLKKDMEVRNYAVDTQNKFVRALQGICVYSNKLEEVESLDYSDVKRFLDYLRSEKQFGASSINNYQAAIKFIFHQIYY